MTEFLVSSFRKVRPDEDGRKVTLVEVLDGAVKDLERRAIQPATQATILNAVGETYDGLGLFPEAVAVWEKALEIRRRVLGENHLETLQSQHNLAMGWSDSGQLERGIPLYERTLESQRAALGDDHLDTLTTLNDLAVAYHDSGRLDRALPLYEEVLRARERKQGRDDRETLSSTNNLGTAYQEAGRVDLAIPLLGRAVAAQRSRLGRDHPETLITLNNLALAYQKDGQADRALALHKEEYEASRARQGDDHPEVLISLNNLAKAYQEAGQLPAAIPLFEQALRGKKAKLGADHPSVLVTIRNLAAAYEKAGRFPDAERLYRDGIAIAGRRKPRDDSYYAEILGMLGRLLLRRGSTADAVGFLRESLEVKEKIEPDDWTTAYARILLGDALAAQGVFPEAERLLLAGRTGLLERRERLPRDRDRMLNEAVDALVRLYRAWNRPAEVERWAKQLSPIPAGPARRPVLPRRRRGPPLDSRPAAIHPGSPAGVALGAAADPAVVGPATPGLRKAERNGTVGRCAAMMVNLALTARIAVMILRGVVLLIRDRRLFRLALVTFWVLLAVSHFSRRSGILPVAAVILVAALWLRRREHMGINTRMEQRAEPAAATSPSGPRSEGAPHGIDLPDLIRPGPEIVPPGDYAMWLPSAGEPLFGTSETRRNIRRLYETVAGVETFAFADLLWRLGLVGEDASRVALPDASVSHSVLGPDDQVLVLSASREKGIRFHFHESATPAYRNQVLSRFVAYGEGLRRAVTLAGLPLDEPGASSPAGWWDAMERVVAEMEGRGEPVQAVGKVLIG